MPCKILKMRTRRRIRFKLSTLIIIGEALAATVVAVLQEEEEEVHDYDSERRDITIKNTTRQRGMPFA